MKSKSTKILQIITGIYAALYFTGVVSSFIEGDLSFLKLVDNLFIALFLIFLIGFALSWTREKIAGIILMIWNAGAWIYDLYLARGHDSGMFCIMAVPVLVIGSLMLLQWYKTTGRPQPLIQQQWKFILRILLINYAVLYAIVVITELTVGKPLDYFSIPFILFPLLLLFFLMGFALSWKKEFQAGLIFLFWFAVLLYGTIAYSVFRDSGPWIVFGIPILTQGLFYIRNHLSFKSFE